MITQPAHVSVVYSVKNRDAWVVHACSSAYRVINSQGTLKLPVIIPLSPTLFLATTLTLYRGVGSSFSKGGL